MKSTPTMKFRAVAVAAVAAATMLMIHTPAEADRLFDLHGNAGLDWDQPTLDFDFGEVTATASATAYDPDTGEVHDGWVGQYRGGLGVTNSRKWKSNWFGKGGYWVSEDGSHTVDGRGWDDTLWLTFSKPIAFSAIQFSHIDLVGEDVSILDGDGNELGDFDLSELWHWGYAYLDISGLDYTGTTLGLHAYGNHDNWKVKGVKGHIVPTPAAAGAGLVLLLGIMARRQRAK